MMLPPIAKKIEKKIVQHGQSRVDYYDWLRDKNWKKFIAGDLSFENSEVLDHLEAENRYTNASMEDYQEVTDKLYREILSREREDDESYPEQKEDYYYYSREEKGKDYSILCRKKGSLEAEEEIYFDINVESEGHALYKLGRSGTNDDNKLFAYCYNLTGSMERTLKIRDLETGEDFNWEINNCTGSWLWASNEHLYYAERDEFSRGKNIYKINVHEGPDSRKLVFSKPDDYSDMFLHLSKTTDKEYFAIYLYSGSTQVVYVSPKGKDEFAFFIKGERDVNYSLEHHKGFFYILTNRGDAHNFKVMKCPVQGAEDFSRWEEFIAEMPTEYISDIHIYNDYLVMTKKNCRVALDELIVCHIESKRINKISMPSEVYGLFFRGAWDHKSTRVRFFLTTPISLGQTPGVRFREFSN